MLVQLIDKALMGFESTYLEASPNTLFISAIATQPEYQERRRHTQKPLKVK